jgi:hypothetical protein
MVAILADGSGTNVAMASWFGVRCVFEFAAAGPGVAGTYEEWMRDVYTAPTLEAAQARVGD